MKYEKKIADVIFVLTIISPVIAFAFAAIIGEADIFSTPGIIRYAWISWLFIPLGFLSILMGQRLKKHGQRYLKNFVVAFICIPILMLFGSYRFVFDDVITYDTDRITNVENETGLELPNEVKIATEKWDYCTISYAKIIDDESRVSFETELKNNILWKNKLSTGIRGVLPLIFQPEVDLFDYFIFYNKTTGEYNIYPSPGEYECIFIAYDETWHRIVILEELTIEVY